jgi:hypothetical protein
MRRAAPKARDGSSSLNEALIHLFGRTAVSTFEIARSRVSSTNSRALAFRRMSCNSTVPASVRCSKSAVRSTRKCRVTK